MSHPVRQDGAITREMAVSDLVTKGLILCEKVLKSKEPIDGEAIKIWSTVLLESKISAEDILPAFRRHMMTEGSGKFMPAPCEIIGHARTIREERYWAARQADDEAKAAEHQENERLRQEAWDSLPEDEKERRIQASREFRASVKATVEASMEEFDDENPRPDVPGFRSMGQVLRDQIKGGGL